MGREMRMAALASRSFGEYGDGLGYHRTAIVEGPFYQARETGAHEQESRKCTMDQVGRDQR